MIESEHLRLGYGLGATLARRFGVSEATISRDLKFMLHPPLEDALKASWRVWARNGGSFTRSSVESEDDYHAAWLSIESSVITAQHLRFLKRICIVVADGNETARLLCRFQLQLEGHATNIADGSCDDPAEIAKMKAQIREARQEIEEEYGPCPADLVMASA
jgi:head-tail adaptor